MKTYVTNIDPANPALVFIDQRLASNYYRGVESSQHNRYTFEELLEFLNLLNQYAPNQTLLRIRTQDTSRRPENFPEETQYAAFCSAAKKQIGKGTQDAMRKNFFVDWHRMGLIERYTKSQDKIQSNLEEGKRTPAVQYVALSNLGKQMIDSLNALEQRFLFSKALNILLDNFISNALDILEDLEYIDFYEFLFFVSAINIPPKKYSFSLSPNECIELIKDYRRLTRTQKEAVLNTLHEQLVPEKFDGDKTQKRDFHNWENKIQQIWSLFEEVVFFAIEKDRKIPRLKLISQTNAGSAKANGKTKMVRSSRPKNDYLSKHGLEKQKGYEFDHIIPLMDANSPEEFHYLDNWRNLLYIDGKTHAIKSQSGSRYKVLSANNNYKQLQLSIPENSIDYLAVNLGVEGLFKIEHIDDMLKYNKDFLEK